MKKPFRSVGAYVVLVWLMVNCGCVSSQPKTLTILHTNDIHASFVPHEAFWIKSDPKPMVGGVEELAWMIDSVRKVTPTTILLDAGDVMTGNPISDLEYHGALGGGLFQMMNMIGFDAWTIGNHDFDISQDNLKKLIGIASFPTVSANITDSSGTFPFNNKPYIILNKNGLRIGVIGIMSKDLFSLTNTKNLNGVKVLPPVETTQKYIDELQSKTDVMIALTHEGVDQDSILAVSTHGLTIIIGGHSHTRLEKPKVFNNVIVCQTGSNCENLGELDVTIENRTVTKFEGKLLRLWLRHEKQTGPLSMLVDSIKTKIDEGYNGVVGTLVSDWKRGGSESNLGDFIADAMREGVSADVGVTNSSGIRKDLSAGPIRKIDISEILPFHNTLCTFVFSGKELRKFAENEAQALLHKKSSLQLSGLKCSYKEKDGSVEVQTLTVGGKDVDDAKQYTIVTNDFVINQGEKYLWVKPVNVNCTTMLIFDAMLAKVTREKTIDSKIENRFSKAN